MRRRSVIERGNKPTEHLFDFFIGKAQRLEHLILHFLRMYADASAARFLPVYHQIVCFGSHRGGVGIQKRQIFHHGHGKRMVHGDQSSLFLAVFKLRKFGNPQNIVLVFVYKMRFFGKMQPQSTQRRKHNVVFIGDYKQQIARLRARS